MGLLEPVRKHVLEPARGTIGSARRSTRVIRDYLIRADDPTLKFEYVRPLVTAIQKRLAPGTVIHVSAAGTSRMAGDQRIPASVRSIAGLLSRTFSNPDYAFLISRGSVVLRMGSVHDYAWPLTYPYSLIAIPLIGAFEPVESAIVSAFSAPGAHVFDVGANFGWHTVVMAHSVGPNGRVHSFEPLPETYTLLRGNVASLPVPGIVECNNEGLSDTAATFVMQVPVDAWGFNLTTGASLERTDFSDTHRAVSAHFTTLDEYCATKDVQRLDFVKCDVEGAEMRFLLGGMGTFERFHPTMLIEVNGNCENFGCDVDEELDYLENLGYAVWAVDERGVRPRADRADAYNFLCVPVDRIHETLGVLGTSGVQVDEALSR